MSWTPGSLGQKCANDICKSRALTLMNGIRMADSYSINGNVICGMAICIKSWAPPAFLNSLMGMPSYH